MANTGEKPTTKAPPQNRPPGLAAPSRAAVRQRSLPNTDQGPRLVIKPRLEFESDGGERVSVSERVVLERRIRALEAQLNETTSQLSTALAELIESRESRREEFDRFQKQLSDLIDANKRLSSLAVEVRNRRYPA